MMKRTPFFLLGAALVAVALVGCDSAVSTAKLVKVTISYEDLVDGGTKHLTPGVWVVVGSGQGNPLFTQDSADNKAPGLKPLAETGMNAELVDYLKRSGMRAEKFDAATSDTGSATSFEVTARPGDKLYFAAMVVPSNDWFAAPGAGGIELFDDSDAVNTGAPAIYVWDAGTEKDVLNPSPPDDDGPDENETVRIVPEATTMFKVTVTVEEI